MPRLANKTDRPITAATGHCVPAGETLTVSDTTLRRIGSEPYIARVLRQGKLMIERDDQVAVEGDITRARLARMTRAELLSVILAHYDDTMTEADFEGVTVEDKDGEDGLRTIAERILFADL